MGERGKGQIGGDRETGDIRSEKRPITEREGCTLDGCTVHWVEEFKLKTEASQARRTNTVSRLVVLKGEEGKLLIGCKVRSERKKIGGVERADSYVSLC